MHTMNVQRHKWEIPNAYTVLQITMLNRLWQILPTLENVLYGRDIGIYFILYGNYFCDMRNTVCDLRNTFCDLRNAVLQTTL